MEQSRTAAPAGEQAPQRIFFGLWPSAGTAAQIMQWAHDAHTVFGGRVMRPETLHLTLAFLGGTPAARVSELIQAAPQWRAGVGQVALRRFGHFARPRIVWAGPGEDDGQRSEWLDTLYDDLWSRLEKMGWSRPATPFRPHVSLLRKAGPGDVRGLQRPPIIWTPERCVLVASTPGEGGSHYRELARMPLG